MKLLSVTAGLLLATALSSSAQETPVPIEPATPPDKIKSGPPELTGGKLLLTTGSGDQREVEIIDVTSAASADAPMRLNFDQRLAVTGASGPVTFVGVSVTSAPAELSNHLPLAKGAGLVVQSVSKDSPAEKAGLQENDILTKFDDQILIHPAQFSVLVADRKENETVKFTLLRKGVTQEIPVILGKQEGGDLSGEAGTLRFGDVEVRLAGSGADAKPIRTMIKQLTLDGNGDANLKAGGTSIRIQGDDLKVKGDDLRQLKESLQKLKTKGEAAQDMAKQVQDMIRAKMEAVRSENSARAAAADASIAGAQAEKAKAEAIRDLEEALRKLREQ